MWSLKSIVESVVEHGRRAFQQAQRRQLKLVHQEQQQARAPNARHKLSKLQSEGGAGVDRHVVECGGGQSSASVGGSSSSVASGLVSHLRPVTARLVQGFVRKVSAPLWAEAKRRTTKRLVFGESAPYFALVGVTLASGSQQGLITKEDEFEALCCNIREAILRAGWLHNPEYYQHQKDVIEGKEEFEELEEEHVFSLADFKLGPVIDKGCSAVVYAARWNEVEVEHGDSISPPMKKHKSIIAQVEEQESIEDEQSHLSVSPPSEEMQPISHADVEQMIVDIDSCLINKPEEVDTRELNVENSVPSGALGQQDHVRRVKFKFEEDQDSSVQRTSITDSIQGAVSKTPTAPDSPEVVTEANENSKSIQEYPLAVKMMFNYEAESNAPAILRAMYKELLPARRLQLDEEQLEWQERFCSKHMNLPSHPNIVEMPCVFVDHIPFLEDSMQLYPDALPARLNPRGFGRNMSLFCVMKRYDTSLHEYLNSFKPSSYTSLLLLTQLLEALLHINSYNVAHRDLKSNNILLSLAEGWQYPQLVVTDFGCSVTTETSHMAIPFPSREADPRLGNAALMAPEVKTAVPGLLRSVNFSHSDIWAVGAMAYEIYGLENPFLPSAQSSAGGKRKNLDSASYRESQLPRLPKGIPAPLKHLIHELLRRNPKNRPSNNVAATLCQLMLWAPSKWLSRHALTLPTHTEIMQWLLCLTTKVLCETRVSQTQNKGGKRSGRQKKWIEEMRGTSDREGLQLEYELVSTFLARIHYMDIIQAIKWNRAF